MKIKELDNRMDEWLLTHCPPVGRASVWVNENKVPLAMVFFWCAGSVLSIATVIANWRGL